MCALSVVLLLLLLMGITVTAQEEDPPIDPALLPFDNTAYFTEITGEVYVTAKGESTPADYEMVLEQGRRITTGSNSFCQILFSDGSSVDLDENTALKLTGVLFREATLRRLTILTLEIGSILNSVEPYEQGRFEVITPAASTGVRGTEFAVSYDPATDQSSVDLLTGQVVVASRAVRAERIQRVILQPDQTLNVLPDRRVSVQTMPALRRERIERFQTAQAQRFARRIEQATPEGEEPDFQRLLPRVPPVLREQLERRLLPRIREGIERNQIQVRPELRRRIIQRVELLRVTSLVRPAVTADTENAQKPDTASVRIAPVRVSPVVRVQNEDQGETRPVRDEDENSSEASSARDEDHAEESSSEGRARFSILRMIRNIVRPAADDESDTTARRDRDGDDENADHDQNHDRSQEDGQSGPQEEAGQNDSSDTRPRAFLRAPVRVPPAVNRRPRDPNER